MRPDYLTCTVPEADPAVLHDAVADVLGPTYRGQFVGKGGRYLNRVTFTEVATERVVGAVQWGGNRLLGVNLDFSGQEAAPICELIRTQYPAHSVSRIDLCVDLETDFDALVERVKAFRLTLPRQAQPDTRWVGDIDESLRR